MGAFCCKEGEQTGEANNLHNRRLHEKKKRSKMKREEMEPKGKWWAAKP
jgi:hypothetical protein